MSQTQASYSIFCDESCHLQYDHNSVMCIGGITVPDDVINTCKSILKDIKLRHGIRHEIKWNTVSRTHLPMYEEIIRFLFESPLTFSAILIKNKSNIQAHSLDRNEYNRFYYSVIERLIRLSIHNTHDHGSSYRVFLDLKDNHGRIKLTSIHDELTGIIGSDNRIRTLQNIRSHESQFIQLADLIIGAITYRARGLSESAAKVHIVEFIEELSGYRLNEGTEPGEHKFSVYNFQPKKRNG